MENSFSCVRRLLGLSLHGQGRVGSFELSNFGELHVW